MSLVGIRRQFPIFSRRIHGYPLTYLDSAATTQKPAAVIAAVANFYRQQCANPRRGLYQLSADATRAVETARQAVAGFVGASDASEIIFTSGATAAINLVAYTWGTTALKSGDGILLTELEHHSNLVPWQQLARRRRLRLAYLPLGRAGQLDLGWMRRHLTRRFKLVACTHTSNALGTRTPLPAIIRHAHRVGARVLVDAAQAVAHEPINVQRLHCDWLVFSGHKVYGPMGVGVLWGRRELLAQAPPFLFGGEMIERVEKYATTFAEPPAKFEAGTLPAAEIVGLGTALEFLRHAGWQKIQQHERQLTRYALDRLTKIPGITIYGPTRLADRAGIISFNLAGVHAHDVAQVLDRFGIAVRAGHHCAMPLMAVLGVPATVRVSFGVYNTKGDIDRLINGLQKVQEIFPIQPAIPNPKPQTLNKLKIRNSNSQSFEFTSCGYWDLFRI